MMNFRRRVSFSGSHGPDGPDWQEKPVCCRNWQGNCYYYNNHHCGHDVTLGSNAPYAPPCCNVSRFISRRVGLSARPAHAGVWRSRLPRADEAIRSYTKLYETMRNYTKLYETIRNYTKLYETLWNYMKLYETLWNYMKLYNNNLYFVTNQMTALYN